MSGSGRTAEDLCNILDSQSRKHHFLERLCDDTHSLFISSQSWEHSQKQLSHTNSKHQLPAVTPRWLQDWFELWHCSVTDTWSRLLCRRSISRRQVSRSLSPGTVITPSGVAANNEHDDIQLRLLSYTGTATSRNRVLISSPVSWLWICESDRSWWGQDRLALFNPPGTHRPPSTGPCRSAELHMPPCWCG